MQLRSIASRHQQVADRADAGRPFMFVLPWQAVAMTLVLTLGGAVHRYPHTFQPLLSYASGMAHAARTFSDAPPAYSCSYAGL